MRGTTEGADCANCPYAVNGKPNRPVVSEYPEDPKWILVGDLPGRTEVQLDRPFCGWSQVVDKLLAKVGRRREELVLTTAILCSAPVTNDSGGNKEADKTRAARACHGRLQQELGQWPGMPILTLGGIAARSVIPQATLDAIDPPSVPKTKKKSQKERQRAELKAYEKARKRLTKAERWRDLGVDGLYRAHLEELVDYQRKWITADKMKPLAGAPFRKRKRPTRADVDRELSYVLMGLEKKARQLAEDEWALRNREVTLLAAYEAAHPKVEKPKKASKKKGAKITDIMSTCLDVDVDGTGVLRPVIPTVHPAMLIKGGGATIGGTHTPDLAFVNMYFDAGKVDALARGIDVRLKLEVETECYDSERAAELFSSILREALDDGAVALDLETYVDDPERHHALMAYVARIKTIGLATENRAVSVMWDLLPAWATSLLQLVLASDRVSKIFHNGLYDRTVLAANGFTVEAPWDDTLLAHHAAFPGNAHRLQVVTAQFFATTPWKSEFRNAEETPEGLTLYNAKDTGATRALMPALTTWVKRTKTDRVYALDKKMSECASRMHLAGMPVCRETNQELLKTFSTNVKESRRLVEAVADDPKVRDAIQHHLALQQARKRRKSDPSDFEGCYQIRKHEIETDRGWRWKISGSKHVSAMLLSLGVSLVQTTKSGDISTKKDILESLAHIPVVRDLLTYRENDKLLSTFVWQLLDRHDASGQLVQRGYADENDRIHPIWSMHKITGRWASSEPVVSNVPKDKWRLVLANGIPSGVEWSPDGKKWIAVVNGVPWRKDDQGRVTAMTRPNLRRQIRAPRGRKFVGFDFSQLEARVIALISGDDFLCSTFADGKDIHRECARIWCQPFDQLGKDEQKAVRDLTKPLEYGAFYGGSVETLWRNLVKEGQKVQLSDIALAVQSMMNRMEGVVRWQRDSVRRASTPPFEITEFLLNRRRTFPLGQVEATEAMNFGVQAAGAAIMNTGMANAAVGLVRYKEVDMIGQFHDAALFECWEDDAESLAKDVDGWFHQEYERDGRSIPFPVEVKIGDTWADV